MLLCAKVDAMKVGVKQFKKEYKKVNIDEIEVGLSDASWCIDSFTVRSDVLRFRTCKTSWRT